MSNTQQEIATPDVPIKEKVRSRLKFGTTKWLTYAAVFVALALVMKLIGQFGTINDSFKITPIYAIWLCAAAALGPFGGGLVCFASDLLGALIWPTGTYNPLLALGCTLYGVIAGFCFMIPTKSNITRFIIAGIVTMLSISLVFDSFAIWVYCRYVLNLKSFMDRTLIVYINMRLLQCLMSFINIHLALALMPLMSKLKLLPTTLKDKQENALPKQSDITTSETSKQI